MTEEEFNTYNNLEYIGKLHFYSIKNRNILYMKSALLNYSGGAKIDALILSCTNRRLWG